MSVLTAVDVMKWIYSLTDGKSVGREGKTRTNGAHNTPNGNFVTTLTKPVLVTAGTQTCLLEPGTELAVYQKLKKFEQKKGPATYGPKSSKLLATIFIKENGRIVRQLSICMDGRVRSRLVN